MGTSVIDPKWFYWMDVSLALEWVAWIISLIGVTAILILVVFEVTDQFGRPDIKWIKVLLPITLLSVVVVCLIPSKDTMITMLVAEMITYENIELTKESAMALIDYIVEQVKGITG